MNATALGAELAVDRQEIVAMAGELARRELGPRAPELDEGGDAAREAAWNLVVGVGFDRALLTEEQGGVELDTGSLLLCLEELATGDAGTALRVLLANAAWLAMPPAMVAEIGEAERWVLAPEPPAGLATGSRISVETGADGVTLNGSIAPVLGALGADGVVVLGRGPVGGDLAGRGQVGIEAPVAVALAVGAPQLVIEPCRDQLGLRSAAAARISLTEAPLGPPPVTPVAAIFELLRLGCAAIARGVARRAQEMALEYARVRVQGGVPIIEHDAVRRMLADMSVRLAASPLPLAVLAQALGPAAAATDGDRPLSGGASAAALIAKVALTEAAMAVALDAVQVFGGAGYMHETGVEKLMRDASYLQHWPEPNWLADNEIITA